jgi:hypothetical protein
VCRCGCGRRLEYPRLKRKPSFCQMAKYCRIKLQYGQQVREGEAEACFRGVGKSQLVRVRTSAGVSKKCGKYNPALRWELLPCGVGCR